ncbi:Hypothetical protein DHA2_152835 [Giardia duodenalis]|uniref:Uncharacterized protein n=1 Tax=Giardia intestinalis TaxID=5741 RepID=V6TDV8_GIAIN|nr:Hypothetical protein DHA2_152835 [Giardia intestinalis]
MLSGFAYVACVLDGPIDEWNVTHILNVFASIAETIGYGEFPSHRMEIHQALRQLIEAAKGSSGTRYSRTILLVLMSLLGVLLLGARSVISPLNLRMVGLEDCIFIDMIKIKVIWSNPYALGLIFLLRLHAAFIHRQDHVSLASSLMSSPGPTYSEGSTDDSDLKSIVDLLSVIIDRVADVHRTDSTPTPDDEYFTWLAFCAFHRYSSRLAETIKSYTYAQDPDPCSELAPTSASLPTETTRMQSLSSCFQNPLFSHKLLPTKSLLLMASMCTDASDDLLNTESLVFPEVQCQVDQDCSNPPSTNDASYIIFLIESYFLLFPDKSAYMADVLCYTPYLPQRFISPIMGLLAPPILTEMSLDLQTTNRNRCILGLIFVNAVLAQTVSAYQYAITSRCLLKQMKFSWIRAYIPLSVLSSNVYFFGARSKVFQITILDDDEYISEVRLLLNNQPYRTESLKNGSQKNSIRRSKKQ